MFVCLLWCRGYNPLISWFSFAIQSTNYFPLFSFSSFTNQLTRDTSFFFVALCFNSLLLCVSKSVHLLLALYLRHWITYFWNLVLVVCALICLNTFPVFSDLGWLFRIILRLLCQLPSFVFPVVFLSLPLVTTKHWGWPEVKQEYGRSPTRIGKFYSSYSYLFSLVFSFFKLW